MCAGQTLHYTELHCTALPHSTKLHCSTVNYCTAGGMKRIQTSNLSTKQRGKLKCPCSLDCIRLGDGWSRQTRQSSPFVSRPYPFKLHHFAYTHPLSYGDNMGFFLLYGMIWTFGMHHITWQYICNNSLDLKPFKTWKSLLTSNNMKKIFFFIYLAFCV